MEIRLITSENVYASLPMENAIEAMEKAFSAYSSKQSTVPIRSSLETSQGVTLLMPACLTKTNDMAVKLVSIYDNNPALGLPRISAIVLVLDPETGRPLSLMDGESLTAIRTGAAGGLAARILSREDAKVVALFGAGIQGESQVRAVRAVRAIDTVYIHDPDAAASEKLANALSSLTPALNVNITKTSKETVQNADIVITATPSKAPVFNGKDLKPGTHVTAIGAFTPEMMEIDDFTIKKSRVYVDSREACLKESGEIIRSEPEIVAEIGEVINGVKPGRQDSTELTLFKSVGIATQDAAAASAVLKKATESGIGTCFTF